MPILALRWGPGTKECFGTASWKYVVLGGLVILLVTCVSRRNQNEVVVADEWEHLDDDELFDDEEYDDELALAADEQGTLRQPAGVLGAPLGTHVDEFGLPHPGASNDVATRQLLMVFHRPSDQDLAECREEFVVISRQALSGDSLVQMRQVVAGAVQRNRSLYHWCFYKKMVTLDQFLKGSLNQISMKQRLDQFLESMRGLWILAQALDDGAREIEYFYYLRHRYQELSLQYFARQLNVVSPPLGHRQRRVGNPHHKVAGEFEDP